MAEIRVRRRTHRRLWAAVIALDTLAFLAMLVIWTHNALTAAHADEGGTTDRLLIDLWMIWGLVPAVVLTIALTCPVFEVVDDDA